jgi:hypothetical protein
MRRLLLLSVMVVVSIQVLAQTPSEAFKSSNANYRQHIAAKDYPAALVDIKEMLRMPEIDGLPGARGMLLYNQACLHSLLKHRSEMLLSIRSAVAAGYTSYQAYATDDDFSAFRSDSEFKTLLSEIKEKYGPKPLAWDRTQKTSTFTMSFDDPKFEGLVQLRREFALDNAIGDVSGDYERLVRLTRWASEQWQHSPSQMASKADPITILREAKAGGRFICRDYAIVTASVARAYGMHARVVNLLPADVEMRSEAHAVAEVWLPQFKKWVIADGQFGIVPELYGIPLSALELQSAIAKDEAVRCRGNEDRCSAWKQFILPNMFYFKTLANQHRFGGGEPSGMLILVPNGAANPKKFAGGNEELFAGAIYTSNPTSFYAAP